MVNSISVISGRWEVDNEGQCAMETRLKLEKFPPSGGLDLGSA